MKWKDAVWLLGLWALNGVARIPAFFNANALHSDSAVVGLQARHFLNGEWELHLWGAPYQGAVDVLVAALCFGLAGHSSGVALLASAFLGHLLLVGLVFALLRKRYSAVIAFVACLPLTLTPTVLNNVILAPPRQWSITLAMAAVFAFDRAIASPRRMGFWTAASAAMGLAVYADLFALQLLPPLAVFGAWAIWESRVRGKALAGVVAAAALPFVAGVGLLWWMQHRAPSSSLPTHLGLEHLKRNLVLLLDTCLPWLMSIQVFVPGAELYPSLWNAPVWMRLLQWSGGVGFFALLAGTVWIAVFQRWGSAAVRLAALSCLVLTTSLVGFLLSSMPSDLWSARYLAPLLWFSPFAIAVCCAQVRLRWWSGAVLALYLISSGVGGWLGFGPWIDGAWPVRSARGTAQDEFQLQRFLKEQQVEAASAQFWLAYRLSFLFQEQPPVVPLYAREDRYRPHRAAFAQAARVAYLFHPSEPRATLREFLPQIRNQGGEARVIEEAGFTVVMVDRR